ncbi:MAG: NADH:flavin oxidoreductase / oxidase family [Pseudomonadota bacterium]
MTQHPSADLLFQPLTLGRTTIPNRIAMAPMTRGMSPGGVPLVDWLLGLACALALGSALAWLLWLVLSLVLLAKALLEERWMTALHPDYASYQARTHRFIPFIL